jgi:uncharacterized peroxidase-related enzyme
MVDFTAHTPDSAPDGAREVLEEAEKVYGFIPNLLRVLADSPQAVRAYWALGEELNASSLSGLEQQVLMLAVSRVNRCPYCMAAHSLTARLAGMPESDLEALRSGASLSDPRLEALRVFARTVTEERGKVKKEVMEAFLSAGFTKAQVLEVMLGIAYKTMSNYVNHVVETNLDEQLKKTQWQPPAGS